MGLFNLLEEKWVDCISVDGENLTVSLSDLILNAHHIESLSAMYPIIDNSLIFLLEALLLSVFTKQGLELADHDTWMGLFEAGSFENTIFLDYFKTWNHRFNLFDENYPFLQVHITEEKEGQFTGTAMKLMPHFTGGTGGNTFTIFDHNTVEDGLTFTPGQAAQYLLPAHYYGAGGRLIGKDYFSDSFLANGLSFFIQGRTLFETLMLNLLPYPEIADVNSGENDCPIWEREKPYEDNDRSLVKDGKNITYIPFGLMDILTWPGRMIELIPNQDGLIRDIRMRSGIKCAQSYFPWFAYNRKGNFIRAREGKLMWRDYDVLLQFKKMLYEDDLNRPPQTIDHLNELNRAQYFDNCLFTIKGAGMAKESGKQKVHFYTESKFPLPSKMLSNNDLIFDISNSLAASENIRSSLYGATAVLADGILSFTSSDKEGRKPDKNDRNNLIGHLNAESVYWAVLEPNFYDLILHLPEDRDGSLNRWRKSIQSAARQALDHAVRLAGDSVAVMKASVHARTILEKNLKEKLPLLREEIAHE